MGNCCPQSLTDDGDAGSETSPLLANQDGLRVPVTIDGGYPQENNNNRVQQSKFNDIVRETAQGFIDINSGEVSMTTSRGDKESIYQTALASTVPPAGTVAPLLPDSECNDPNEIFSKTNITVEEIARLVSAAQEADELVSGYTITLDEKLVEEFNNTPTQTVSPPRS